MGLRFFVVPVTNSEASEQELNDFLASHKVVSIDRKRIDQLIRSNPANIVRAHALVFRSIRGKLACLD